MEGGESYGIPSGKERQTARHWHQNVHDEGYKRLVIESVINAKNRMEFRIYVDAAADVVERLNARYQTLIS